MERKNPYNGQEIKGTEGRDIFKEPPPITWIDPKTGEEYNPAAKVYTEDGVKRADGYAFNDKGEINAYDKQDAFRRAAAIIADMNRLPQDRRPIPFFGTPDDYQKKMQVIAEYVRDPSGGGLRRLGQELLNPIKEIIDYEGWARKLFVVRPVKQGEVVKYDRDVFVVAWQIAQDGETPQQLVGGEHFYPDEFEITALPSLPMRAIYQAQYDIIARTQDRARQAIEYMEDVAAYNLLKAAASSVNQPFTFTQLDLSILEALRRRIERHRLVWDKLLINRSELSDFVIFLTQQVDPVTQRALIMLGYVGNILGGAKVIVSAGVNTYDVVKEGEVIAVTAPEYLGGMPIRIELISEPVTYYFMGKPEIGWFWYELLSMIVINPAGVAYAVRA